MVSTVPPVKKFHAWTPDMWTWGHLRNYVDSKYLCGRAGREDWGNHAVGSVGSADSEGIHHRRISMRSWEDPKFGPDWPV